MPVSKQETPGPPNDMQSPSTGLAGTPQSSTSTGGPGGASSGPALAHPTDAYNAAPYGKACAECVKTKRKCMLPPDSGKCHRCQRLNKTCNRPPASGVRKRAVGNGRTSSRAVLEEKLDNLVNLLQQQTSGTTTDGIVATADSINHDIPTAAFTITSQAASGLPVPMPLNVAPSPGRATLEDLAEASASASSVPHLPQPQRTDTHNSGSYVRPPTQHMTNQSSDCNPPMISRQMSMGMQGPPTAQPMNGNMSVSYMTTQQSPVQNQEPPRETKRATMPNIFNPAREFLTASLQDQPPLPLPVMGEVPDWMPTHFTVQEEDVMLAHFRDEKSQYYPFIYIPQGVTSTRVKAERPFLWLSIMAVSTKVSSQQMKLSEILRNVVGKQVVSNHDASLDLLQGLLVYLAWSNYQLHKNVKPFMCMYSHIAMGLLSVINMFKPHCDCVMSLASTPLNQQPPTQPILPPFSDRDLDEKRATLGLYYITSSLTSFLHVGSMQGLRWNSSMDEMLSDILTKRPSPYDIILVIMVKCQLIIEDAIKVSRDVSDRGGGELTTSMRSMQHRMLQERMKEVKSLIPRKEQNHYAIRSAINTAEMTMNEVGCWDPTANEQWINTDRIIILNNCFQAVQNWLRLFFQLPLEIYISLPFTVWCQMFRTCCILCKLSTIDDKGWDRYYIRSTLDVLTVISDIEKRFRAIPQAVGFIIDVPEGDAFARSCRPLQYMRKAWESYLLPPTSTTVMTPADSTFESGQAGSAQSHVGLHVQNSIGAQMMNDGLGIDFGSDFDWFADMYYVSEKFS